MAAARTVATVKTASMVMPLATAPRMEMNLETAKQTFEETCSQCHGLKNVEKSPPATPEEVTELIERMVENGLAAPQQDLVIIQFYLTETYTKSH
jgi:mono/diheme cytochrome c family protein